jgi:hypothetical protein
MRSSKCCARLSAPIQPTLTRYRDKSLLTAMRHDRMPNRFSPEIAQPERGALPLTGRPFSLRYRSPPSRRPAPNEVLRGGYNASLNERANWLSWERADWETEMTASTVRPRSSAVITTFFSQISGYSSPAEAGAPGDLSLQTGLSWRIISRRACPPENAHPPGSQTAKHFLHYPE